WLTQRNAKHAEDNALKAQIATIKAREDAAHAEEAAVNAAMALVKAAKTTNRKLGHIANTSDATHAIVNNQRTTMLRAIAVLSRRAADDRPKDAKAMQAADDAENDLRNAEDANASADTKP